MTRKPPRGRTDRRERERAIRKILRDKERLFTLSPGGSKDHPISVTSSSVIDVRAGSTPCPLCDGPLRVDEQTADSATLRTAHVVCNACGSKHAIWFRITTTERN